jgi:hypothetical protein
MVVSKSIALMSMLVGAVLVGCKYGGDTFPFAKPIDGVLVSADARLEDAGSLRAAPDESLTERELSKAPAIGEKENLRFAPVSPDAVKLLSGRDRLNDYLVLGVVTAGDTGGIGAEPERTARKLRVVAALVGADAVIDVHALSGSALQGLAVRKRDRSQP